MARHKLGCSFAILVLDRRDQALVLRSKLISDCRRNRGLFSHTHAILLHTILSYDAVASPFGEARPSSRAPTKLRKGERCCIPQLNSAQLCWLRQSTVIEPG